MATQGHFKLSCSKRQQGHLRSNSDSKPLTSRQHYSQLHVLEITNRFTLISVATAKDLCSPLVWSCDVIKKILIVIDININYPTRIWLTTGGVFDAMMLTKIRSVSEWLPVASGNPDFAFKSPLPNWWVILREGYPGKYFTLRRRCKL